MGKILNPMNWYPYKRKRHHILYDGGKPCEATRGWLSTSPKFWY